MVVLRNVGAVILGLIVGMIANMALGMLNLVFFPLPEGVSMWDTEALMAAIRDMPPTVWILPLVAHLAQAFVGGWVAARLGGSRPVVLALIVGVLSLVGGIMNALSLQPPPWAWIEMPLYLVVAWYAGSLEARRRAA